jgi:glucose-1-phosphate adenylyltransferase
MRADEPGRIVRFREKPKSPEDVESVVMDPAWIDQRGVQSKGRECLASMGIYIFSADVLRELLAQNDYQDFGKEVFPASIDSQKVQVHLFDDYWEDIGTIKAFYDANLMLAGQNPAFQLVCQDAPIYSRARFLPPSQLCDARVKESIIADGCRIGRNVTIERSVIGLRCIIGDNVTIRDSIIMGADMYESERLKGLNGHGPALGIGDNCVIEGAIIDKNCRIARGARIVPPAGVQDREYSDVCSVSDGIPVIVKDAALEENWSLPS